MYKYKGLSKAQGHQGQNKTGILLVNLGTPDEPTTPSVRRYLAEFLADPRVVEIPRFIWMLILHGIILRTRPAKSAALYKSVWTEDGSPLMAITKQQQHKLSQLLQAEANDTQVYIAMRYGNPSIASTLQQMQHDGVNKIVVLPLYPQYAAPTTGTVFDAIAKELTQWRLVPSLHFINGYYDNPLFIKALARSIRDDFEQNGQPQKLILSYHGMPERNLHLGDPYYCYCIATTKAVAAELGLSEEQYMSTFQSRFGKAKWLTPYTDETLAGLPAKGVKDIAVICPAFSADCLETLEEICEENKEVFEQAGGESYRYIAALNADDDHIEMMLDVVKPYL